MIDFKLKRGMNLDHHVAEPGKYLAQEKYFKAIREAGFDHVRLPFEFSLNTAGIYPCDEYYARIKATAQMALDAGLCAMVDVHPFHKMQDDPHAIKPHFYKMWGELADALKDMDDRVIFEIYNEPDGAFNFEVLNEVQNEAISIIRKTNPKRQIAAACAHCNTFENLCHLVLPEDDENIFVTIHEYTPMSFTHQGADWMKGDWPTGIHWGTQADKDLLKERFNMAAAWGKEHNRRLHLGEFGAIKKGNHEDRVAWTHHLIKLSEERNIAWCYWELGFVYAAYDLEKDEWDKEFLNIFQNP